MGSSSRWALPFAPKPMDKLRGWTWSSNNS
jgi:hypothetical protein